MSHIAICCQGGGSHTAFTGGALSLLLPAARERAELVTLTGTSGGAVCAAIASSADDPAKVLAEFWQEQCASTPVDVWLNFLTTHFSGLLSYLPPCANPMQPAWSMRDMLARHLKAPPQHCLIGACDVLSGEFVVFRDDDIGVEQLLASCTVPYLFPATEIDGAYYWDGLYSQNPPIANLFDLPQKPAEIWLIRIDPKTRSELPVTTSAIEDRSKELAYNNALEHELKSIERINRWLAEGVPLPGYQPVTVRQIVLDLDLPNSSKLDRNPDFIAALYGHGLASAQSFLSSLNPT